MIWNWLRRHPLLVDVGLVMLIASATIAAAVHHGQSTPAIALGVVETLPLLWRRKRPLAVTAIVTAVALALLSLGMWLLPLQLGVALYTLAAVREPRVSRAAGVVSVLAIGIALVAASHLQFGDDAARVVFLVAAWLLGESVGSRRAYVREVEQKAERLEREREAQARRVAAEEQARIGRELHDVVAHALSVIIVQAGAAEDVFSVDPRRTRGPIRAIDAAARAALADLRRVLGILHVDTEYEPQPSLAGLETLIEQVRATGLRVALEIDGAVRPLPAAVDLSAYRIVQEALTNTLKHAGAEHATVHVHYGVELGLEIRDDGRGRENGTATGRGLIGMRERVTMLGGSLETATDPGGGFLVSARVPLERAR